MLSIKTILEAHPQPWRYVARAGEVTMLDAANGKVELFTVLDFTVQVTANIAAAAAASVARASQEAADASAG